MRTAFTTRLWHGALLCALLTQAGCGTDAPPAQTTPPREEMTGTATTGTHAGTESVVQVSAKGSAGRLRTSSSSTISLQYAVSLTQLTGPYALSALVRNGDPDADGRLYSVAAAQGNANITPLTTLLVAQLYGQDPAQAYAGFGPAGNADPARITPENLSDAQIQLKQFIREELGLEIPDATGDFVTASFQPAAGDAMYDTLTALAATLTSKGLTLTAFADEVAQAERLCLVEQVTVTADAIASEFCPQSKSATPASEDPTRLDYLYTDRHGNRLSVTVQGNVVSGVTYATTGGITYACTDAACGSLTLGSPAADGSRTMQFADLSLASPDGHITINGLLTGAVPGVVLPVLPCDNNRYFVVFSDRSVVATCVNPDPYGFGIGATLGNQQGVAPSRMRYDYATADGVDPTRPQLSVLTDANDALLAVQFVDYAPGTYTPRRTYACKLDGCNGVTLGPVSVNTDILGSDPPILIRTVTLDNTVLKGYDADGRETGDTATLSAAVNTAYFDFVAAYYIPPIEFTPPGSCGQQYQQIGATADGTDVTLCLLQTGSALVQTNGDIVLASGNYETDNVSIVLRNGAVVQASIGILNQPLSFVCNTDCTGISVSPPDADGVRTLQFQSPLLREAFLGPLTGVRGLTVNGGTVTFGKEIPQP